MLGRLEASVSIRMIFLGKKCEMSCTVNCLQHVSEDIKATKSVKLSALPQRSVFSVTCRLTDHVQATFFRTSSWSTVKRARMSGSVLHVASPSSALLAVIRRFNKWRSSTKSCMRSWWNGRTGSWRICYTAFGIGSRYDAFLWEVGRISLWTTH